MTDGEKRIQMILRNYAKGKYTLPYLKSVLERGLEQVEALGVKNVNRRFIENLAHLEEAIRRIERSKITGKERNQ